MRNYATKVCVNCGKEFSPTSGVQKVCSECKHKVDLQRMRDRHHKTYVRKGYNQSGENNNNWKGGIGVYRKLKSTDACELCGSTNNLLIHHKDHNRYNNELSNLIVLCKTCHQENHCVRDSDGRYTSHS